MTQKERLLAAEEKAITHLKFLQIRHSACNALMAFICYAQPIA